jgi:hypothetical protein
LLDIVELLVLAALAAVRVPTLVAVGEHDILHEVLGEVVVHQGRVEQEELLDQLRPPGGEVERDVAAVGIADDRRRLLAHSLVERCRQPVPDELAGELEAIPHALVANPCVDEDRPTAH